MPRLTNNSAIFKTNNAKTYTVAKAAKIRELYGPGEPLPIRKDAWTWYWSEKAHLEIDPQDKSKIWGNDRISLFFKDLNEKYAIPLWNGAMEYDFVRGGLLLALAGMLLGLGASFFIPHSEVKK